MNNNTTLKSRTRLVGAAFATLAVFGSVGLAACSSPADAQTPAPVSTASQMSEHDMSGMSTGVTDKQVELHTAMQSLWDQHMEWTWNVVVAFVEDSPALDESINRLLENQTHIGDAVKPFYGEEAGDALTALLKEHITDAVPVLTAGKAGNTADLEKAVEVWYANAEEIGRFLASANPHWDEADTVEMMRGHITQTVTYASDLLQGDYAKAIADYDVAQSHMAHMGQFLSDGLVAQFPEKFE